MDHNLADSPDSGKYSVCLDFPDSDLDTSGYIMGRERDRKPVQRTLDKEYNDIELQVVENGLPINSTPRKPGNGTVAVDTTIDSTEVDMGNPAAEDMNAGINQCWTTVDGIFDYVKDVYRRNKKIIHYFLLATLLMLYMAYLIYACIYDLKEAMTILIITAVAVALFIYGVIRDTLGDEIYEGFMAPSYKAVMQYWDYIKWVVLVCLLIGIILGLFFLTRDNPIQLVSFAGLAIFILFCFIISKFPRQVKWRPVIWGLALQFILGLFILRTHPGFVIFNWLGDIVQTFLGFSSAGSKFLFGDVYQEHYFAFAVLPIVIYFSSAIAVLYYWGVMQTVISKIAWLMQRTMKTSASESLSAAGNIFIGQTEAPLLIRPYLEKMTRSEIHAVMTGGFATIAGSVLGAFVLNGISATHLIAASVMSAPAALAVAKLVYPETERSKTVTEEDVKLPKGEERNVIEAASKGASTAIPLVLNIAANLVTFLALKEFLNGLLGYLGGLVGIPQLTFELICSYVFMPIAFIMGVEWADCGVVAELIGIKTFINEFVAYDALSVYIKNRENGGPTLSARSEVIATYALCGFANIASIGIQLGGLTPMAPSKAKDLAAVAVRALIAGTVACFMTASIAGVLYVPENLEAVNATIAADMATTMMTDVTTDMLTTL